MCGVFVAGVEVIVIGMVLMTSRKALVRLRSSVSVRPDVEEG